MPRVRIVSQPPWGIPGTVVDERTSVFRPLRILREKGQPPGILSYAYLAPIWEEHDQITVDDLRNLVSAAKPETWVHILGAFCNTRGGRLLFVPGWLGSGIHRYTGGNRERLDAFNLDHLTLEADHKTWHATSVTRDHVGAFRTFDNGDGRRQWFYLALKDITILEPVYSRYEMEVDVAHGDQERWVGQAQHACKSAASRLIKPGDNRTDPNAEWFWRFEIFLTTAHWAPETETAFSNNLPPEAGIAEPHRGGWASILYDFEIPTLRQKIWIGASRVQGHLNLPVWMGECGPGRE